MYHKAAADLSSEGLTGLDHQLPGNVIHKVVGRRNPFFTGSLTVLTPGSWFPQNEWSKKERTRKKANAFYVLVLEITQHHFHIFHSQEVIH